MSKFIVSLIFLSLLLVSFVAASSGIHSLKKSNSNSNISLLTGMELPEHLSFNAVSTSADSGCNPSISKKKNTQYIPTKQEERNYGDFVLSAKPHSSSSSVKLQLKHRSDGQNGDGKELVVKSTARDLIRIQTLHTRITEKKNQNSMSRLKKKQGTKKPEEEQPIVSPVAVESPGLISGGQLTATLESGVSLGSGEYFMDVFVGTPPKHFSLILDTGSDLNWIQCVPCYDCFEQNGPHYAPMDSTSFKQISCHDPRCQLVSSPDPPQPCEEEHNHNHNQTCPYFYWYGDSSNTTGDFALETFTVNLTSPAGKPELREVKDVMFGCGHWNRGLFHGAAGLLGLGRGPLSFSSQLQSLYGHSFSYCLVDRNSNSSVTSKLIFGEDKALLSHPQLNFTSLVTSQQQEEQNTVDTFYYVQIKSIVVGGEVLNIPEETWNLSAQGAGGTIVDSGTTLSYFADPAYKIIKEAFEKKVKKYPVVHDFPMLSPCYNVSSGGPPRKPELPTFGIVFGDGATWNFPVENYFIKLEPEEIVCLAILGTPRSALSIIGNYQQQNFHVLYDTNKSRLGFAPANCADV